MDSTYTIYAHSNKKDTQWKATTHARRAPHTHGGKSDNDSLTVHLEVTEDAYEMRIDSSQIWLTSTRSHRERHEERESLHAWVDSPNARAQTAKADEAPLGMKGAGPVSSQDATACAGCASAGGAGEKKLLLIPSATHNDVLLVGFNEYFNAIDRLIHRE